MTLSWQLASLIIGALGIATMVTIFLFSRREKVEIEYANMSVQLEINKATGIRIECAFSLLYVKGTRDHYVSEIWLEFDKHLWKKLEPYFEVPLKACFNQDALPKLELGKLKWLGNNLFCPARRALTVEEHKELDDIVQKFLHRYKIGWKDTYGKTQWKIIHQLREWSRQPTM